MKTNNGYSLIEVVVVLGIIAILSGVILPDMQSYYQKAGQRTSESQLSQLIHFAQSESRVRREPIGICAAGRNHQCQDDGSGELMVFIDRMHDGVIHDSRQIIRMMSFAKNGILKWRAYPYYRHYVLFSSNGMLDNDNGTFWYCQAGKPYFAMTFSKSGMTKVILPDQQGQVKDAEGRILMC